jgi:alpha-1,3-rhamnosyltransferase
MNDLISVIIPIYNHEQYIQEAIQSIINQNYQNLELIIIDDGSKDNSFNKALEMEDLCKKRFSRFLCKKQKNKGVCETCNQLIKLSRGNFLFLMASDDKILPNTINTFYDFLSKNDDYALVVGQNLIMDSNGKECFWDKDRNNIYEKEKAKYSSFSDWLQKYSTKVNFGSEDFGSYESLLNGNYIPNGSLVKKDIYKKTGLYTKKAPLEDYYMNLQIAKYAKMKFIDIPAFYYRWHNNNVAKQSNKMRNYLKKTLEYEFKLIQKSRDKNLKKTVQNYKEQIYGTLYVYIPNIFEIYYDKKMRKIYIKLLSMKTFICIK